MSAGKWTRPKMFHVEQFSRATEKKNRGRKWGPPFQEVAGARFTPGLFGRLRNQRSPLIQAGGSFGPGVGVNALAGVALDNPLTAS